jgi:hypothetical protein
MIEHPPGSNEWYQAYYLQESLTEYRIRFPATRKTKEDRVEWIDKRSSRIWRGENGGKYWRYIKKSEGMWIPKTQEELAGKGKKGKGAPAGGGKAGAGKKGKGKGQQRGSKQSTVEDSGMGC